MKGWSIALLLCAALAPFLASRHWPEIHDDVILRGPGSLAADQSLGFAELVRADLFGDRQQLTGLSGFWRPALVLQARAEFWITDGSPRARAWLGHVMNLLLHALATLGLWHLVQKLGCSAPVALLAATLFGVHPVHAEPVAWISARSDLGSAALGLWGIVWTLRSCGPSAALAQQPRRTGLLCLAGCSLLGALFFKESALLLVLLAALLPRLVGSSWTRALALPVGVLALYGGLRVLLFERGLDPTAWLGPDSLAVRWWTWLSTVPEFLRLCLWPGPTVPVRPIPPAEGWGAAGVMPGLLALAVLLLLAGLCWRRRWAAACLAALLMLGSLLVLAPWVRIPLGFTETSAPLAERYTYLAAAAPGILLGLLLQNHLARSPGLAFLLTAVLATALAPIASARAQPYRSDEALARASLAQSPRSANLHNSLGVAQLEQFRVSQELAMGELALASFERALAYDSGLVLAAINRMFVLALLGRQDDAEAAAHHLEQRFGGDRMALTALAEWSRVHGRTKEAEAFAQRAADASRAAPQR
ncbi:MAG: hypothetical protein ACT4PU_01830 [Planctomycetota bacterium]